MSEPERDEETISRSVRNRYGGLADGHDIGGCGENGHSGGCSCCEPSPRGAETGCCAAGYTDAELTSLPEGSNLGLGCGNPSQLAGLRPGEVVLDLGSGAGVDCFLAASKVGPSGQVIGVDMTPEMISRARGLARSSGRINVQFRLGEIEHLPVADASVDVVLSNCVINLVPDKGQVYREAFRVLRSGGRLVVADVLATRPISDELRNDSELWASCSSGALTRAEVTERLITAGFESIQVSILGGDAPTESLRAQDEIGVVPGEVRATKPGGPHP
ncbi:MAG: arsenite methyltransferase [Thermoplasmata archaeon]